MNFPTLVILKIPQKNTDDTHSHFATRNIILLLAGVAK